MSIADDNRGRQEPCVFVEFRPSMMRRLIEDAIESLLLLLDEIDGDADFEEEPDNEEGGDSEPILGSLGVTNQAIWGHQGASFVIDGEGPDDNGIADLDGVQEQLSL